MSTRSIIARPTPHGFAGRYVHDGGHPRERIPTLLEAVQRHFAHNLDAAARFYLEDHPGGWRWLGTDFTTPPGWSGPVNGPRRSYNRCYCHGGWDDGPTPKCTQNWASHLLPWTTEPSAPLSATLR